MPLDSVPRNGRAALQIRSMCNICSITTNQDAIRRLLRTVHDGVGDARPALVARDVDAFRGIFGDLVPQRSHGDAEQACRDGAVSTGIGKRFQNQVPFDVSKRRADQPPSETAARRRGNRNVRPRASHCATPLHSAHYPSSGDSKKVNDFLTRPTRSRLGAKNPLARSAATVLAWPRIMRLDAAGYDAFPNRGTMKLIAISLLFAASTPVSRQMPTAKMHPCCHVLVAWPSMSYLALR